jgi:Glycosyl hydrolase family 63 C-terminal domain
VDEDSVQRALALEKRSLALIEQRQRDLDRMVEAGLVVDETIRNDLLLSVVRLDHVLRILETLFDEDAFLSPYGLRALSRFHAAHPFTLGIEGTDASVDYEPAESTTGMFGGNSNWRGPIWMPVNYLVVSALRRYGSYFRDAITVEYPTGSGNKVTLAAAADDLRDRLVSLFLVGPDGRRPCFGWVERFQQDPRWRDNLLFNEYFHGDNGAGLGASHQTGWTGIVADLIVRGLNSDRSQP